MLLGWIGLTLGQGLPKYFPVLLLITAVDSQSRAAHQDMHHAVVKLLIIRRCLLPTLQYVHKCPFPTSSVLQWLSSSATCTCASTGA